MQIRERKCKLIIIFILTISHVRDSRRDKYHTFIAIQTPYDIIKDGFGHQEKLYTFNLVIFCVQFQRPNNQCEFPSAHAIIPIIAR